MKYSVLIANCHVFQTQVITAVTNDQYKMALPVFWLHIYSLKNIFHFYVKSREEL